MKVTNIIGGNGALALLCIPRKKEVRWVGHRGQRAREGMGEGERVGRRGGGRVREREGGERGRSRLQFNGAHYFDNCSLP
jgi:hypothetical protein